MAQMIDTCENVGFQPQDLMDQEPQNQERDAGSDEDKPVQQQVLPKDQVVPCPPHIDGEPYKFNMFKMMNLGVERKIFEVTQTRGRWQVKPYTLDLLTMFTSCHQVVQMPISNRLFITGGLAASNQSQWCWELRRGPDGNSKSYSAAQCTNMASQHEFHSACFVNETQMMVSGSRISGHENKVELYDIVANRWTETHDLIQGRSRHSSCSFRGNFVYVICGWVNRSRSNTIEFWNTQCTEWTQVAVKTANGIKFEERLTPGILQIDQTKIAIFGGFGKMNAMKDCYEFDPLSGMIEKKDRTSPIGMEVYYKKAFMSATNQIVYGIDVDQSIWAQNAQEPYFEEKIGDFIGECEAFGKY